MGRRWLVAGGLVGAGVVVASIVVPSVEAFPGPDLFDVVLPLVLIGCSLLLADRGRYWAAALLGAAGALWCAVGVASALSGPLADAVQRLGLFPLAMVVIAAASLPGGTSTTTWAAIAVAVAAAVVGGSGATTHGRVLLGALLVVMSIHRLARAGFRGVTQFSLGMMVMLLQGGFGFVLVVLDPSLSTAIVSPAVAADAIALGMAAVAFGVLRILDPRLLVRATTGLARTPGDRLGVEAWLGDLLGAPHLRITYPTSVGDHVLENGEPWCSTGGIAVTDADDQIVACFDRLVVIDPFLRAGLLRILTTVGDSARLRAAQKLRSAELERSRTRLAEAAMNERVALERRLSLSVLPRLDAIGARSSLLPDPDGIGSRVDAARAQVLSVSRGLAPVDDRGLAAGLMGLASLAPDLVSVNVGALDQRAARVPDISESTALWFSVSEAVANALKHASGSAVCVRAVGPCALEVTDAGDGGADPTGSGIAGIRDRLAAVGGHLDVDSGVNGTRLTMSVPGRIRAGAYSDRGLVTTTPQPPRSYGD